MTAAVIIGVVALILVSVTTVAVTVLVSRALADAFRALDRMHVRANKQQDRLLDRLAAIKWEDLAALRSLDDSSEEGRFITPEEQANEEGGQDMPRPQWGALRALRDRMTPEEQELLDEDFNAEGEVTR